MENPNLDYTNFYKNIANSLLSKNTKTGSGSRVSDFEYIEIMHKKSHHEDRGEIFYRNVIQAIADSQHWGKELYKDYWKCLMDYCAGKIDEIREEEINKGLTDENTFKLEAISEKLLFIKYSGLLDCISKLVTNQTKVASVIGSLTGERQATIRPLIGNLLGNRINAKQNNPYTKTAISKTINALSELGIDSQELNDISIKNTDMKRL